MCPSAGWCHKHTSAKLHRWAVCTSRAVTLLPCVCQKMRVRRSATAEKTNVLAGLSLLGWCGVTGDLRLPAPLIWKHTEHHTQAGGDTRNVTNKQLQILLSWNLISVVLKRTGYVKVSLSLAVIIVIILLQKFLEQKLKKNFSLLQKTLTTHQYL